MIYFFLASCVAGSGPGRRDWGHSYPTFPQTRSLSQNSGLILTSIIFNCNSVKSLMTSMWCSLQCDYQFWYQGSSIYLSLDLLAGPRPSPQQMRRRNFVQPQTLYLGPSECSQWPGATKKAIFEKENISSGFSFGFYFRNPTKLYSCPRSGGQGWTRPVGGQYFAMKLSWE